MLKWHINGISKIGLLGQKSFKAVTFSMTPSWLFIYTWYYLISRKIISYSPSNMPLNVSSNRERQTNDSLTELSPRVRIPILTLINPLVVASDNIMTPVELYIVTLLILIWFWKVTYLFPAWTLPELLHFTFKWFPKKTKYWKCCWNGRKKQNTTSDWISDWASWTQKRSKKTN